MMQTNLIQAWTNIDKAADPTSFVRRMDQARAGHENNPAQYAGVADLLDVVEGQNILDVGCGTGGAVRVFAERTGGAGRVVGLDISKTMIHEARRRTSGLSLPVEFREGDAHRLPFPDNSFDRCYALRLLEVIDNPVQVLREMHRVLRPGGRIFVNGPDIDTWTFDSADRLVTRKIVHYFCDKEVNGWIGRQTPRYLGEIGLREIKTIPATAFLSDYDTMCDLYLTELMGRAKALGIVSQFDADVWMADLRLKFLMGTLPCSQTFFRVAGEKAA
jgi:SAM-dependent methyltransferase